MIFLDASAIVKAYVAEIGSIEARSTLDELRGRLYLTPHIVIEVLSVFAKKLRANKVKRRGYRAARSAFFNELASLNLLDVDDAVFTTANHLVDVHWRVAAGAMDIIHVASALQLQATLSPDPVIVASSDRAFLTLARAAGLPTFDPENESFGDLQARLG